MSAAELKQMALTWAEQTAEDLCPIPEMKRLTTLALAAGYIKGYGDGKDSRK